MLSDLLANGLVSGALIALLAAGFSLVYTAQGFFVFTFGASYSWAAYTVLAFREQVPLVLSTVCGVAIACTLAMSLERLLYQPLRRRKENALVLMLVSIGAYAVLENLVGIVFGDSTRRIADAATETGLMLLGAHVSKTQLLIVLISLISLGAAAIILHASSLGNQLRAVANDELLARVVGIKVDRVCMIGAGLGGTLGGIAGILQGIDTGLVPTMGFQGLLLAVLAAVVGGVNSFWGATCGGFLIGLVRFLAVWRLPVEWQDAIVFLLLFIFLIVRPEGLFGKPLRGNTI